jgi:hypothetical protein
MSKKNKRDFAFPKPPPKTFHKRATKVRLSPGFIVLEQTNIMFGQAKGYSMNSNTESSEAMLRV